MFQGGGARLAVLIAAAEALEDLESTWDELKIVQAAGVSAGSIAAAALAAPEPVSTIRKRLADAGGDFLASEGKRLNSLIDKQPGWDLNTAKTFHRAINGQSLLTNASLRKALKQSFSDETEQRTLNVRDDIDLTVFVSNLRSGESVPFSSEDKNPRGLIDALHKSAALPFVFSTFSSGIETDGGVTGNLPLGYFIDDADRDAKILAFDFQAEPTEFENAIGYARALLASAMNASVREAVSRVRKYGGTTCTLPDAGLSTFAFEDAISLVCDEARYDLLVRNIRSSISESLTELFCAPSVTQTSQLAFNNSTLNKAHSSLIKNFPYSKPKTVQAQVLRNAREYDYTNSVNSDKIHIANWYKAESDRGLKAILLGLPFGPTLLPLMNISVRDANQTSIDIDFEIVSIPHSSGRDHRRALIFLRDLVETEQTPLVVTTSFEFPAFTHLRSTGFEGSCSTMVASGSTNKSWIVVAPPAANFEVKDIIDPDVRVEAMDCGYAVDALARRWSAGTSLDSTSSQQVFAESFTENLVPETKYYGWSVHKYKEGTSCGFILRDIDFVPKSI